MQLVELRENAACRGWHIVAEYLDRGVSGSSQRVLASLPKNLLPGAGAKHRAQGRNLQIVLAQKQVFFGQEAPTLSFSFTEHSSKAESCPLDWYPLTRVACNHAEIPGAFKRDGKAARPDETAVLVSRLAQFSHPPDFSTGILPQRIIPVSLFQFPQVEFERLLKTHGKKVSVNGAFLGCAQPLLPGGYGPSIFCLCLMEKTISDVLDEFGPTDTGKSSLVLWFRKEGHEHLVPTLPLTPCHIELWRRVVQMERPEVLVVGARQAESKRLNAFSEQRTERHDRKSIALRIAWSSPQYSYRLKKPVCKPLVKEDNKLIFLPNV